MTGIDLLQRAAVGDAEQLPAERADHLVAGGEPGCFEAMTSPAVPPIITSPMATGLA
jgi:hypothetical protein